MKALYRDLRAVDRGLPNELKRELRDAVEPTVTLAKVLAPVGKTRRLRNSIRAYPAQKAIAVRATARNRRDGFLYPAVYEYGGRRGRAAGPRAYLNPALDRTENQVVDRVARGLGDFMARHGL
jgi:hypothetical protein